MINRKVEITLEKVLNDCNIERAIQSVQSRSDIAGNDGIRPSQLEEYWKTNKAQIMSIPALFEPPVRSLRATLPAAQSHSSGSTEPPL